MASYHDEEEDDNVATKLLVPTSGGSGTTNTESLNKQSENSVMMGSGGNQSSYGTTGYGTGKGSNNQETEVTTIAAFANLGTYFSLPISLVNDFFGARVCSIVSAFLFFAGYFLFLLLYTGIMPNHYLVAGLFFMIMGSGSAGGYLASISTNLKNFSEKNRGLVVGVLASCFGLSSFVFSSIYTYVFSGELEGYLYFTAIFGTVVIFSGCIFMNSIAKKEEPKKEAEKTLLPPPQEEIQDQQQEEGAVVTYEEAAEPQVEKKVYADISANKSLEPPVNNPFGMLMTLDFYIMFIVYMIGSGCGLVIINNLGAIVIAYGGYNGQQNLMVQLLSIFNCLGRIAFGFLSDKFLLPKYHLTRVTFFNIAVLMMGVMHFIFAWAPVNSLYFFICVMGFFNGGIFSLAPSFCSERFGAKYFGMNFSIMNLAAACGSYGLATFVTGQLYQINIDAPRTTTCHGHDCFQLTFFITSSLCGFAFILGLFLQYRTRWVYWIFFRRRITQSKKQV
ncbi:predicted protein [Naegleria gruberi]|uniref:Predicted protein n=1 Tax=Naegleria gruberi TaxID=5762 RepID=D2VEA7_NAEGR|nr:uncharacterized protein NAEGRDRAFT_79632 [Naegleria gruberi]EFC44765.1 predicted protein [Naegleria gruberi]|eukprot:XP_002677509.1 predicted protein [Naegleria gruberi strain NEG-M]